MVAQICQRLDGIALAIELAAARVKTLKVEQIAARLDDVFHLLTGGSRTALPRQQTLRALIDWSYNLLTEAERAVLRHLSVFMGGWTLEAAEAVCSIVWQNGVLPYDNLDLLTHLVDKSLVADEPELYGAGQVEWLQKLELFRHAGSKWGVRHILGILGYVSEAQGDLKEAQEFYAESLAIFKAIGDLDEIGWTLFLMGNLAGLKGDGAQAIGLYEAALENANVIKNKPVIGWILGALGCF